MLFIITSQERWRLHKFELSFFSPDVFYCILLTPSPEQVDCFTNFVVPFPKIVNYVLFSFQLF
jgi:hypothetical protein